MARVEVELTGHWRDHHGIAGQEGKDYLPGDTVKVDEASAVALAAAGVGRMSATERKKAEAAAGPSA